MFFGVGGDTIPKALSENVGKGHSLRGGPLQRGRGRQRAVPPVIISIANRGEISVHPRVRTGQGRRMA